MITIKNLRTKKLKNPWDIRVDRVSVLGNIYFMSTEKERNNVCDKYQVYFYNVIKANIHKQFILELEYLYNVYKLYKKLNLFCWCTPKRCHAETIKEYLLNKKETSKIDHGN